MNLADPKFDAIEVNAVLETTSPDGNYCEVVNPGEPHSFWSIYLHDASDFGVECIADCPNKETAFAIARALMIAHPNLAHVYSRDQSIASL